MKSRGAALVAIALLVLHVGLLVTHGVQSMALLSDQVRVCDWVEGWGAWAPLAMITLQVAQVLLAPIPGQIMGLASGYLFGVTWGTIYSVAGNALGSLIAFSLARAYGRPLVERLVPAKTLCRLDAGAQRRGLFFFVLIFLLPFLPDDLACLAAGLTSIPIPALMLAVMAGRPPGILVSCWLGANAVALGPGQWAIVIACSALLACLFLFYGADLQEAVMRLTERPAPKRPA